MKLRLHVDGRWFATVYNATVGALLHLLESGREVHVEEEQESCHPDRA